MNRALVAACALVLAAVVGLLVVTTNRAEWEPIPIAVVRGESVSDELTVTVEHAACRRGPRVGVVAETGEAVRLSAEQDVGGDCEDIGLTSDVSVRLRAPLGARRIEVERGGARCLIDGGAAPDRCVST